MSLSTVYLQYSQVLSTNIKVQIMVRCLLPTSSTIVKHHAKEAFHELQRWQHTSQHQSSAAG